MLIVLSSNHAYLDQKSTRIKKIFENLKKAHGLKNFLQNNEDRSLHLI